MNRLFYLLLLLGLAAGVAVGWACNQFAGHDAASQAAEIFGYLVYAFSRLVLMVVAPLVFALLVAGTAGAASATGSAGARLILAVAVILGVGLLAVDLWHAGANAKSALAVPFSVKDAIGHVLPSSIVDAMAKNEIVQMVVFSVFVGAAIASLDERAPQVVGLARQIAQIMLKVASHVMMFAPLALFAALAKLVTEHGVGVFLGVDDLIGALSQSLGFLWTRPA